MKEAVPPFSSRGTDPSFTCLPRGIPVCSSSLLQILRAKNCVHYHISENNGGYLNVGDQRIQSIRYAR